MHSGPEENSDKIFKASLVVGGSVEIFKSGLVEARNKIWKYLRTQEFLPEESVWELFEAEEKNDVGQYSELMKWCMSYLQRNVSDSSDSQIGRMKGKLNEMAGVRHETLSRPKNDCFGKLIALNVPLSCSMDSYLFKRRCV